MKNYPDAKQVVRLLSKDLRLEDDHFNSVPSSLEGIREKLKWIIEHLLQNDFERLLNAMYRLDIDESKFKSVISGTYGNDVAGKLAEIVIERELKKIETRKRYRGDNYD
jgi:hypothetical protein